MKIAFLFLLSLVISCTNTSTTLKSDDPETKTTIEKDTIVPVALQQLYSAINNQGRKAVKINTQENQIILGDSVIRLKVKVDFEGQKENKSVFAANFITSLHAGNETEMSASAIGIGATKKEAFDICIHEWMNNFGLPLSNLINTNETLEVGTLKVYPGNMGVRGKLPKDSWLNGSKEMHKKIIASLSQIIKTNKKAIIAVDLKLLLTPNGVADGECRLGNFISFELLNKLKQLPWPPIQGNIIFSQYYLVQNTEK